MRYGVLGTGVVGRTLGSRLVGLGHDVTMGSRDATNPNALGWAEQAGERARVATFAEAAAFGERVICATAGAGTLAALGSVDPADLDGKVLIDVSNPLDFSSGFPPRLFVTNDDSLGEQVQRAHPQARVVKALNTVNCAVMVEPERVPGEHVVFVCGEDATAKDDVRALLGELGWPAHRVVDLGGIDNARATEAYLALWVRLMRTLGTADFNLALQVAR